MIRLLSCLSVFWVGIFVATEVVAADGMPETPDFQNPDVEAMAEYFFSVPLINNIKLSPGGEYIALAFYSDGKQTLAVDNLKDKKQIKIDNSGGYWVPEYYWIDDENIFYRRNHNKYTQGTFTTNYRLVSNSKGNSQNEINQSIWLNMLDPLPGVEKHFIATGGFLDYGNVKDRPGRIYMGYRSKGNEAGIRTNTLDKLPTDIAKVTCDTQGQVRFISRISEESLEYDHFYRQSEDEEWLPVDLPKRAVPLGFDTSGGFLLLSYENEDGYMVVQGLNTQTLKLIGNPIAEADYDMDVTLLKEQYGGAVVGIRYHGAKPKTIYFHPTYKEAYALIKKLFPGASCRVLGFTHEKKILYSVSSDVQPLEYIIFCTQTQKFERYLARYPWIEPKLMSSMQPITVKARDGINVHGYLTLPKHGGEGPHPTVVMIHGGPRARDTWGYNADVQFLAGLGYAVLQVNYRGSSGFGSKYTEVKVFRSCEASVDDTIDCVDWAIENGYVDKDRVAIMGASFGGYAALASAAFEPDRYKVAIGFAGVYDWVMEYEFEEDRRLETHMEWLEDYYGDFDRLRDRYAELSPVNHADAITAKVLLVQGNSDNVIDTRQIDKMKSALDRADVYYDSFERNEWVHGFYDEDQLMEYWTRVGEFLQAHL